MMLGRLARRYGYPVAVLVLLGGIIVMTGVVITVVVLPELGRPVVADSPSPSPTATAPTGDSPMGSSPIGIAMPSTADCTACHLTDTGIGTKPIPVMAHPLEGWTDCTACHATGRLVQTAPGHSGLHKDQCLICHKPRSAGSTAAPQRPHHVFTDQPCITCHGTKAPLPTDMSGRHNCWICHPGADTAALFNSTGSAPTAPSPSP